MITHLSAPGAYRSSDVCSQSAAYKFLGLAFGPMKKKIVFNIYNNLIPSCSFLFLEDLTFFTETFSLSTEFFDFSWYTYNEVVNVQCCIVHQSLHYGQLVMKWKIISRYHKGWQHNY